MKLKSMFLSKANLIVLAFASLFVALSTSLDKVLVLCVDCIGPDCGYCTGCHPLIDCFTQGLIKSYFTLSILVLIFYIIIFAIIYFKKK